MNKKIEVIDFLRGFSIFSIALMHLMQPKLTGILSKAIALGGAGVHVFILLSGFGLYLSYLRKPIGYGEFYKKRFSKVYYPYAIIVILWSLWYMFISNSFPLKELLSHLLLYKMFDARLDVSLCYPFWFISTIIQFYILWPLIRSAMQKEERSSYLGLLIALSLSLAWATLVGTLGFEELRPWGSCFMQYLWEFYLGMFLAKQYINNAQLIDNPTLIIDKFKFSWLFTGAVIGIGMNGAMGWAGGIFKLYNDIPSVLGYICAVLILYKVTCNYSTFAPIKKLFVWANSFSYELYLMHSLVFAIMGYTLIKVLPLPIWIGTSFALAYIASWLYHKLLFRKHTTKNIR